MYALVREPPDFCKSEILPTGGPATYPVQPSTAFCLYAWDHDEDWSESRYAKAMRLEPGPVEKLLGHMTPDRLSTRSRTCIGVLNRILPRSQAKVKVR